MGIVIPALCIHRPRKWHRLATALFALRQTRLASLPCSAGCSLRYFVSRAERGVSSAESGVSQKGGIWVSDTTESPQPPAGDGTETATSTDIGYSVTKIDRAIKDRRDTDVPLVNWWLYFLVLS